MAFEPCQATTNCFNTATHACLTHGFNSGNDLAKSYGIKAYPYASSLTALCAHIVDGFSVSFCEKMSLPASKARAAPRHRMPCGPLGLPQSGVHDGRDASAARTRARALCSLHSLSITGKPASM